MTRRTADRKKRQGRGRLSTIDLLPEDIRLRLNAALREKRLTQQQILDAINPLLEERGAKQISKSSLNRYSMQIEERGAMMREAREAANALVGGLGEQKGTDLGRAVTEMVKTLTFDLVAGGGELDVDTLNKVALVAQRIERASKISIEREAAIKKQAQEEALAAIEESGKDKVLTAERIREIKEMFGL